MILTDREIKFHLERGLITIDPPPAQEAYSSTSVDLTLDEVLSEFKEETSGIERSIDPAGPGFNSDAVVAELTRNINIGPEGYLLKPRLLVLA